MSRFFDKKGEFTPPLEPIPFASQIRRYSVACISAGLLIFSVLPTYAQSESSSNKPAQTPQTQVGKVLYKGIVYDDLGEPLPGVHVSAKSLNIAAATDMDGRFTLMLPEGEHTLEITYIGMKPITAKANRKKEMKFYMETDAQMLKETVVTGIYTRNIESFTGAVSTFNNEELKQIGAQNILRSLSVLDPSFIITDNNLQGSNPNAKLDISINGKVNVTDLTQEYSTDPNQPLFILDGFESSLEAIQDLNMDRVESISILKDAASTAIYGSKAANGVVVVETIKPKQGQLRFSYNGSFTFSWPDLSDYNLMNAEEKLEFEKLAGVYKSYNSQSNTYVNLDENGEIIGESQRAAYYAKLKLVKEGHDTYWMNEPIRNGLTQGHNIYVDGGDQSFLYGIGLSYNNTQGVMKGSNRDVLNGNIRLTYRLKNLSFTNQTTIGNTVADNNTVAFSAFTQMNPFYDKWTVDGDIPKYVYKESGTERKIWNPMWDFQQNSFNTMDTWNFTNNFQMDLRIFNALRLRGNIQYQWNKSETEVFRSPNETAFNDTKTSLRGSYTNSRANSSTLNGRINLTYGISVKDHTFNAVAGMQFNDRKNDSNSFMVQGYSSDQFYNPNFSNGYPEGARPSSTDEQTRSVSYYTNFNYSYKMRYLLDFNLTRNGASQFGIDNPFSTTWSFGLGWNVHNEKFLENNKTISYLKLRYSLGNPGNQNYDAKLSSSIYSYVTGGTNPFGMAANVTTWGNNGLKWQRTVTHNFGLDINMFNDRLNFTTNYQIRKTDPLLVRIDLPTSTGSATAPMNVGATDNRSISFNLTYYIFKQRDLSWYVSANGNHYTTKYYNIGNLLEEYNKAGRASASLMRYYDNASTTALYVVRSAGIDPATGNEIFLKPDGSYTYEWKQEYEVEYGDTNPDLQGAFNTTLVYKGFTLGASFTYRFGGDTQLSTLLNKVENISDDALKYNQDRRALHSRWQKPGDIVKFKRIDDTSTTHMSSRFVAEENTIQCSSIRLGYQTSTAKWLKNIGATSVSFNAYMNNIFRISTIKEERGTSYPFERSVTCSVGINF